MPRPWSPSPATASMRPSSSSASASMSAIAVERAGDQLLRRDGRRRRRVRATSTSWRRRRRRPHRCDAHPRMPPSRRALAVGRGVRRCGPVLLELLVEPHHGQRAARHVEAGDQLADLGLDDRVAAFAQQPRHGAPDDEQFLVLGAAESVEDHRDSLRLGVGMVAEHAVDERGGQVGGRRHRLVGDARLTVDAEAEPILPVGHGEQRMVGAGHACSRRTRRRACGWRRWTLRRPAPRPRGRVPPRRRRWRT